MSKKDPRGDGAVLDDHGQPNIIDYANQEPLLFGLGENSSHEYPGKIVINNESRYMDNNVKRETIPNASETGKYSTGSDKTQPTIPTGAPNSSAHGFNINNQPGKINFNQCPCGIEQEKIEINEAVWNEQEHPRAPAGTMHGGEFIKKDGPPMAKEDKEAREKWYEPTNQDNIAVEKLQDEITMKTLDRNIARVKKDDEEADRLDSELNDLKALQQIRVKRLEEEGKLEGTQAQRALIAINKAKAELENKKPGTKSYEKSQIDLMGYKMRLDMIRRGVIPDYDINGKPTNEAAFQEKKEEQRVEKAMSKRPVKTKQKDLESFKDIKNIKLGKQVDKNHVKQIEEVWNSLDSSDRKLVDNLMIRSTRKSGAFTAGEWNQETNGMDITVHPLAEKKDYEETIHHEIGHAKFKQYSPEKIEAWNKAIKEIRPPTWYAQYHQKRFQDYRINNFRVRPEDKPIVERNLKALENLYYEEVHSEVYANMKTPLREKKIYNKNGLEAATQIYKEIFG